MSEPQGEDREREMKIQNVLGYLDRVKMEFQDQPARYEVFLEITRDFKANVINIPGIILRVVNLFRGYPDLVERFKVFVPWNFVVDKDARWVRIDIPWGTISYDVDSWAAEILQTYSDKGLIKRSSEGLPTKEFVQRVKARLVDEPHTYRQFLALSFTYAAGSKLIRPIILNQMKVLLSHEPDLAHQLRVCVLTPAPPK